MQSGLRRTCISNTLSSILRDVNFVMAATLTHDMTKPRVIILGGCGFIGRNLVHYLIDNDLVSTLRVVDKVPPQTAWLNKIHRKSFDDPKVEFVSANLILPASCETAFADDGNSFDLLVNCASETKPGQTELVYKEGIVKLLQNCASQAVKHKIKKFVEISSGQMASSSKAPHTEEDTSDPWTGIARLKLQAEAELARIEGLNYCILRPAIVYGLGDRHGLAPRFVVGGVYKHMKEVMKLLWDKDLRTNTVHVTDVCRAIWFVANREDTNGQVYNVVDNSDSTQGTITELVSEIFGISHDYWGNTLSLICKTDMSSVVEEGNDKHLGPWAEACSAGGVENTPLTPYMDQELLLHKHLYLDGSKLRSLGFSLSQPKVTKDTLKEVLDDHAEMNLFPRALLL